MWSRPVTVCEKYGLNLRVTEWSRRGFPCLLIHGFGDASGVWRHLATRLMAEFHVVGMDLRGHGDSDWDPEHRYDTDTFSADLNQVVATFGFERMILVGHSFGAEMAIYFAASHPSRVAGLVIADYGHELSKLGIDHVKSGFLEMPRSFASVDEYTQWLIARRPLADQKQLEHFARQGLRPLSAAEWRVKTDPALADSPVMNRAGNSDRYVDPALWEAFKRIVCPILVVRGGISSVLPPDVARRMVESAAAGSRAATIRGAGHAVMMDNPVEFTEVVARFVRDRNTTA